jgi:hypothetical protein
MTPVAAFASRDKAGPRKTDGIVTKELRVRHDKVDHHGVVTIRYRSKMHHIGMGRSLKGTRIILLVAGRQIRVLNEQGELLREIGLDPSRDYQPQGGSQAVHDAPRHVSTMARDRTQSGRPDSNRPPPPWQGRFSPRTRALSTCANALKRFLTWNLRGISLLAAYRHLPTFCDPRALVAPWAQYR